MAIIWSHERKLEVKIIELHELCRIVNDKKSMDLVFPVKCATEKYQTLLCTTCCTRCYSVITNFWDKLTVTSRVAYGPTSLRLEEQQYPDIT